MRLIGFVEYKCDRRMGISKTIWPSQLRYLSVLERNSLKAVKEGTGTV